MRGGRPRSGMIQSPLHGAPGALPGWKTIAPPFSRTSVRISAYARRSIMRPPNRLDLGPKPGTTRGRPASCGSGASNDRECPESGRRPGRFPASCRAWTPRHVTPAASRASRVGDRDVERLPNSRKHAGGPARGSVRRGRKVTAVAAAPPDDAWSGAPVGAAATAFVPPRGPAEEWLPIPHLVRTTLSQRPRASRVTACA